MKKIFMGFFLIGISAHAQTTAFYAFTNQDNLHGIVDTTHSVRNAFQSSANYLSKYGYGITSFGSQGTDQNVLVQSDSIFKVSKAGLPMSFDADSWRNISAAELGTGKPTSTDLFTGIPNQGGTFSPSSITYKSSVTLPNSKGGLLEFHDHEVTTISETTVTLTIVKLNSTYDNTLPTTLSNGATITQNAVYKELWNASGGLSWMVATAPTTSTYASIELNTSSNLATQNNKGAFSINISDGNSLRMATDENGGYIGWKDPNKYTNLTLSAGSIDVIGRLMVENTITSKLGITVGDAKLSTANITNNAITFADISGVEGYIGRGLFSTYKGEGEVNDALVLSSGYANGIVLNAFSNPLSGTNSIITFSINSNPVGKIMDSGMLIGEGSFEQSAILTINSLNQGVIIPRLIDLQMFEIHNPAEGTLVYRLDHHALASYDGNTWRIYKTRKLRKLKQ